MLTIYRASAGAGKTHRLTGEYLSLLFSRPGAFRRILAVTFTNKATDEMKSRIVGELYNLASGRKSDYVESLSKAYSIPEQDVRDRAQKILVSILHDYSAFNISTIDRFFQQTTRAFAREIGLQGGYGIEMDKDVVLNEAVDRLLAKLDAPESRELLGWLIRFAEDKIEDGKGWNLRGDILALANELFKESYKAFSDQLGLDLSDKSVLEEYKERLYAIIASVESELKRIGGDAMRLMEQFALEPSDFVQGSRSPMFLFQRWAAGEMKEPTATFLKLENNMDAYTAKSAPDSVKQIVGCVYNEGLNDCVCRAIKLFNNLTNYNTAREITRYYYTLGILSDISDRISEYRDEKNVMLIADTAELLNRVIAGSDAPFIYEKTGTRIDHYMIDEFQDTSAMQWDNFRPLVEESLANGRDNLIVGDVKQSIYRFRNSDWNLLDRQVRRDFGQEQVVEETLKDNWRSCREIVGFNNSLFKSAPTILQELYNEKLEESSLGSREREEFSDRIISAYANSSQEIPPKFMERAGHVRVDFLQGDEEQDWKQRSLEMLPNTIERLQDNGYELKDIAILVRTNYEGAAVAEKLLAYRAENPENGYRYDIISDEALFISSSPSVRLFVSVMRYMLNPADRLCGSLAEYTYQVLLGDNTLSAENRLMLDELMPLSRLSLYESAESLYRHFSSIIPVEDIVFVQAFLDMVSEFAQSERGDMGRFIRWWDEIGSRKTIATPDGQNAIRILTVHKSKGLGFKVVIIPFGDWEIDHKPNKSVIVWCHPEVSPFDRLRLVPVRYGASLGGTIFAYDYFKERLHAFIDNLNTLYVAFTRSKEELIVCCPKPKKLDKQGRVEKISSIGDLLWAALTPEDGFDTNGGVFERGEWWHTDKSSASEGSPREITMTEFSSISPDNRLRLRLHGRGYFFDDPRRKHGALMHELLSRIRTSDDIDKAVDAYRLEGVINRDEAQTLVERLHELLAKDEVKGWYDGNSRVLNEVDILFGKGYSKRPDRVMIKDDEVVVVDYKFGEKIEKRYDKQVKDYLRLIGEMGYQTVSGFLWYVELGKIEQVKA